MDGRGSGQANSRGRFFVYAGVFIFVSFLLILDVLVGSLSLKEFFVLLLSMAALFFLIEGYIRITG